MNHKQEDVNIIIILPGTESWEPETSGAAEGDAPSPAAAPQLVSPKDAKLLSEVKDAVVSLWPHAAACTAPGVMSLSEAASGQQHDMQAKHPGLFEMLQHMASDKALRRAISYSEVHRVKIDAVAASALDYYKKQVEEGRTGKQLVVVKYTNM